MKRTIISLALMAVMALAATSRDRLYIENFNIGPGETLQVPVILLNDTAYCGLQTDLYLPAGLSLDMEYDEYIIDLTSRKHSSHTVASRLLDNGSIRIYVSSMSAKEFSGNSGPIMTISLTASSDFSGEAIIELKNSICAEAIGTRHVLDDEVCLVNSNPEPVSPGDVNGDGIVDVGDVIGLIEVVLRGETEDACDLNGDGYVDVGDVIRLIDWVLNGIPNNSFK